MHKLFSTSNIPSQNRYGSWLAFCDERLARLRQKKIGEETFSAELSGADIGNLMITRSSYSAVDLAADAQTIKNTFSKPDAFFFNIKIAGMVHIFQGDTNFVQGAGDTSLYDLNKPLRIVHPEHVDQLIIQMPRQRLEEMLGPAHLYTGLTMSRDLPATKMVRGFFNQLIPVHDRLTPALAERLASVGIDLIIASIAERMSLDIPKPLHGTVVVQRAKAHIETNLGDPLLDPPQIAAAVGVSLRHLQQLFHDRGQHISDWIWQRRLEVAAQRLADPTQMHLSLGTLSYGCGFSSQTHFSRRFKDRYDLSPGDYRRMAVSKNERLNGN